jgi:hypothetical protein
MTCLPPSTSQTLWLKANKPLAVPSAISRTVDLTMTALGVTPPWPGDEWQALGIVALQTIENEIRDISLVCAR